MAIRHLWFLFSLAVATVTAILSPHIAPSLIDQVAGLPVPGSNAAFQADLLLHIATGMAAGALVLFILFYVGLSLVDGMAVAMARRKLNAETAATGTMAPVDMQEALEGYPVLETPVSGFISALRDYPDISSTGKTARPMVASPRPAHHYFGAHKTVHARTYRWLFDPLPVLLLAAGVMLLMLKAASGLGQRGGPPVGELLVPQIIGLLLLAMAALLIFVIRRVVLGIRYQQTIALCDCIDAIFPTIDEVQHLHRLEVITREASKSVTSAVHGMSKELGRTLDTRFKDWQKHSEKGQKELERAMVNGLEEALKPSISALVTASERTGQDIAAQSRDALEAVLNTFLQGLQQHFGRQTDNLKTTLEETEKAARDMHKAYRKSLEEHHKSVQDSLQAYAGSFGQTAASFESLQTSLDNLLAQTTPLLRQMISHQEGLIHAMEQESASSKVIGRAAGELSLAAQASRETVEQFVTLAERLREASKVIGSAGSAPAGIRRLKADKALVEQLRALKSEAVDTPEQ